MASQVLSIPPLAAWLGLARSSRDDLAALEATAERPSFAELRHLARVEACEIAAAWDGQAERPALPSDRLWLATGHQPVFFHPGIWAKHVLLTTLRDAAVCLNIVVDSDEVGTLGATVPRVTGRLALVTRALLSCAPGTPFELAPAPSAEQWQRFIDELRADVQTLGQPLLVERVLQLAELGKPLCDEAENLAAFMTRLRRALEPARRPLLDLPLSRLSQTRAFGHFLAWIVLHAERFWHSYNRVLPAHAPVAALRASEQGYELPLWTIRAQRREPVFVRRDHDELVLSTPRHGAFGRLPAAAPADLAEQARHLALRPRALLLTQFVRLFLADLFLHGTGGMRYERSGDALIRTFYAIEPPPYAVASATFHLELSARGGDLGARRRQLHEQLRELRYNPERKLDREDPAVLALVEQKTQLLAAMHSGKLTRRERRQAYHQLSRLTEELATRHEAARTALARELAQLEDELAAEPVVSYREFPLFLFDRVSLEQAILREAAR